MLRVLVVLSTVSLAVLARAEPPAPAPDAAPPAITLLRVDLEDGFALHPWLFHEHRFGETLGVVGALHFQTPGLNGRFPAFLELDLGPVLHFGGFSVSPQLGADLVFVPGPGGGETKFGEAIFELYLTYASDRLVAESWNLYFVPFDGAEHFFQMRLFANVRPVGGLWLGPHLEATVFRDAGIDRFAIGGDLGYSGRFGQVTLFLASERERGVLEARLTYVKEL